MSDHPDMTTPCPHADSGTRVCEMCRPWRYEVVIQAVCAARDKANAQLESVRAELQNHALLPVLQRQIRAFLDPAASRSAPLPPQPAPDLAAKVATLFDAIKHGDEKHQAWLRKAIDDHFAVAAPPQPGAAAPSTWVRSATSATRRANRGSYARRARQRFAAPARGERPNTAQPAWAPGALLRPATR